MHRDSLVLYFDDRLQLSSLFVYNNIWTGKAEYAKWLGYYIILITQYIIMYIIMLAFLLS